MKEQLAKIRAEALSAMENAQSAAELDGLRVQYLGKKGELTAVLKMMGKLSPEERPAMGQLANDVRAALEKAIESQSAVLAEAAMAAKLESETLDVSIPGKEVTLGHKHPMYAVLDEIKEKQQQNQELSRSQVDAMLQVGVSPSAGLIGKSGYESEYVKALENYYKQQAAQAAAKTSGRSGGTTRRSGGTSGGNTTDGNESGLDYQGLFEAAKKSGNPKSWLAQKANYQKFGFTSSSGLYSDYETWLENGGVSNSSKTMAQGPFIALLSGFNTSLKNGEGERILSTLDKSWPMMTSEQKAEMQKLLKQYGYSYEEG